jgi:four helix bundle protein
VIADFGLRIAECECNKGIVVNADDFRDRTKRFAIEVIRFADTLPRTWTSAVVSKQMVRCGTSVGANYRAACRAKSRADFIAKMGIVEEECDEVIYWI